MPLPKLCISSEGKCMQSGLLPLVSKSRSEYAPWDFSSRNLSVKAYPAVFPAELRHIDVLVKTDIITWSKTTEPLRPANADKGEIF